MFSEHLLRPECETCGSTTDLRLCSGCRVFHYCSTDHQAHDWDLHKMLCKDIRSDRRQLEAAARDLPRAMQQDGWFDPGDDVFEKYKGRFWGILPTRPYMQKRFAVADRLLTVQTHPATEGALQHMEAMLQLCRGDNLGVRDMVAPLYLRLGRDQECYDFIKWWKTVRGQNYDFGDMDLGYLDIRGADAFEQIEFDTKYGIDLSFAVPMTLLKVRMLQSLRALEKAGASSGGGARLELGEDLHSKLTSSIISGNPQLLAETDHSARIATLEKQVQDLFARVHKINKYFWGGLVSADRIMAAPRPGAYTYASREQAHLTVIANAYSWEETPGAMALLPEYVKL